MMTPSQSVLEHVGAQFQESVLNFGIGTGPIFLGSLDCRRPDDNTLLNCTSFSPLGLPNCRHERDVGVHCEGISTIIVPSTILSGCSCGYFGVCVNVYVCVWDLLVT